MKKLLKIKTLAICAILLAGIIFPTILTAQRSDGFFKSGDEGLYENRDEYTFNDNDLTLGGLTGENPTTVPLGSGLLVLSIVGAGYAVVRGKRSLKTYLSHLSFVVLALAMFLGMTQCKKQDMVAEGSHKVFITVDVDCSADKTTFIPGASGDGSFVWTDGKTEYIEVGHSRNSHVGRLKGRGNGSSQITFEGILTMSGPVRDGDIFSFFYLGSSHNPGKWDDDVTYEVDIQTTLHITDQYGIMDSITQYHWAVGSYTCRVQDAGQQDFHIEATLEPAMSILYVNLTGFDDETIRMYGDDVYSIATIDYANGTIVGKEVKGGINLGTQGEKYIALIPSSAPSTTVKFASNTKYAEMNFNCGIRAGKFYSNGGSPLPVEAQSAAEPKGALPGLFSVANNKQVNFSKGNLQYQASTDTWRFALNQWDYVGGTYQNVDYGNVHEGSTRCSNNQIASTYTGWIDLFGWGTSGYHNNADENNVYYYPYARKEGTQLGNYISGYGPTSTMPDTDLTGSSIDYDWGMHNAISYGDDKDAPGRWRTLTRNEWDYLLTTRTTDVTLNNVSDARYTLADIQDGDTHTYGLILVPDAITGVLPTDVTWGTINNKSNFTTICNKTTWSDLEQIGFVFLPAGGIRTGTNMSYPGTRGYYWSSMHFQHVQAYYMYLGSNGVSATTSIRQYRKIGSSVRLVRDAN